MKTVQTLEGPLAEMPDGGESYVGGRRRAPTIPIWSDTTGTLLVKPDGTTVGFGGAGNLATDTLWDAAGDLVVGSGPNAATKLAMGTALQTLRVNAGATGLEYAAPAAGDMVGANNLSDVLSAATSRTNLGLTANGSSLVTAANYAAMRALLDVEAGVDVQAWDAELDAWATKTAPTGTVVGTSDTQTLTGKTLTAPRIGTSILDADGNELFLLTATPNAVNELTYANAATGSSPTFTSSGGDAVVGLNLVTKGGGTVQQNSVPVYTVTDARAVTLTPSVMGALAIDVTLADNTKSVGASTFTYSGTPVAGRVFYLTLTNSVASAQVYTFPSTYSTLRGANITTVTLPASATYMFAFKHDGSRYMLLNEPMIAGDFGVLTAVASAATTDIGAANSINVNITGTTTITGFGTVADGVVRFGRFDGALTLTHNATSLKLPGGANITTAANDRFIARSLGSGNWEVLVFTKASGQAVVGGTSTAPYSMSHMVDVHIGPGQTTYAAVGAALQAIQGTVAAVSTSFNTSYGAPRGALTTAAATVDSSATVRIVSAGGSLMPGSVDAQRVLFEGIFAPNDTATGRRWATGLYRNNAGDPDATQDPENWISSIIFGKDNDDTNVQVMHNDGTGLCTKVDLGANFPANTSNADLYYGRFIARGGATPTVDYYIKNLVSGNEASGSLTTNLPAVATILVQIAWVNTGPTTASTGTFHMSSMKVSSYYTVN